MYRRTLYFAMIFIVVGSNPVFAHIFFAHSILSVLSSGSSVGGEFARALPDVPLELLSPFLDSTRSAVSGNGAMLNRLVSVVVHGCCIVRVLDDRERRSQRLCSLSRTSWLSPVVKGTYEQFVVSNLVTRC